MDARFPTCVHTGFLRGGDAFCLAISADVSFELREDGQHSGEGVTGRRRGIKALLENAQMGASFLDFVGDVG